MNFLCTVVEKHFHVVAQLRATHDGIVAEEHALAVEHGLVGNELHLGHQGAHFLIGGGETAGPCGGVFTDGTLVRALHAVGISEGHSNTRIRDATHAINLRFVVFAHDAAALKASFLHVASFVG